MIANGRYTMTDLLLTTGGVDLLIEVERHLQQVGHLLSVSVVLQTTTAVMTSSSFQNSNAVTLIKQCLLHVKLCDVSVVTSVV